MRVWLAEGDDGLRRALEAEALSQSAADEVNAVDLDNPPSKEFLWALLNAHRAGLRGRCLPFVPADTGSFFSPRSIRDGWRDGVGDYQAPDRTARVSLSPEARAVLDECRNQPLDELGW
jgi:hypothetical protein